MAKEMAPEYKVLFDLIANALFSAGVEINPENVSLEKLYDEAKHQTVVGITFDVLPEAACKRNKDVYGKWQAHAFMILKNNIGQMYANAELEKIFSKAGVDFCTFKGFASAYYYPNKSLRQMGDIDFIIPQKDFSKGKELLNENGFKCIDEDEIHTYHIGYVKNKTHYEMHKSVTELSNKSEKINELVKDIYENSVKIPLDDVEITVPAPFLHGVIMLLHMKRHMTTGGGIGLRHLCDWAVFVNSFDASEWKELFESRLKEYGLWEFARAISQVASIYLKMPSRDWFCDVEEELAEDLLCDIMLGGNFGHKDIGRYQELVFINQNNGAGASKRGFFSKLSKKVREWHPVFRKNKIMFFFGLFAYPVRTAVLMVLGKRQNIFAEKRTSGTKRNDLYDRIFK